MKTQQERILERLRAGKLNSYEATYEMRIKQAPTRLKELRERGYMITSIPQKDRSVDWVLNAEPIRERKKTPVFDNVNNSVRFI